MGQSIEKILRDAHAEQVIDYRARVVINEGRVEFYMHPDGVDGETIDFVVSGDQCTEKARYDRVMAGAAKAHNA